MSRAEKLPRWVYRLFKLPGRLIRLGLGQRVGPPLLVVTTTGRRSGLPRETPLQYELVDGAYCVGSMRGSQADWYRNILADAHVLVTTGGETFPAVAEAIDDHDRIAAFLQIRLQRSPRMIGAIMRADGFQGDTTDEAAIRRYAQGLTMVALHPLRPSPETKTP
jgi:deazaflavin-dependent oxidoreductase (nitroreductase family)